MSNQHKKNYHIGERLSVSDGTVVAINYVTR